jgi:hypothetical protein
MLHCSKSRAQLHMAPWPHGRSSRALPANPHPPAVLSSDDEEGRAIRSIPTLDPNNGGCGSRSDPSRATDDLSKHVPVFVDRCRPIDQNKPRMEYTFLRISYQTIGQWMRACVRPAARDRRSGAAGRSGKPSTPHTTPEPPIGQIFQISHVHRFGVVVRAVHRGAEQKEYQTRLPFYQPGPASWERARYPWVLTRMGRANCRIQWLKTNFIQSQNERRILTEFYKNFDL